MDFQDRKVMLDNLEDRVTEEFLDLKDVLAFQVCQDRKVNLVDLVCLVLKDSLEPRETLDGQDNPAILDKVVQRDNRDYLEEMVFPG